MVKRHAGILGLGVYLPDEVRDNDWWPEEIVAKWAERTRAEDPAGAPAEGPVKAAIESKKHDVFAGSRERHIIADDMEASDMEIEAGRRALADAGVRPEDVDLLIVTAFVPEVIGTNAACTVHEALGLPQACICFSIDSNFNGFHHQVALAESLIASGRARTALLVQSSCVSRMLVRELHYSPWFGDGATAVVVGSVGEGYGVLAQAHRADGSLQLALLTGVPGGRWNDEGRSILYSKRPDRQREVLARVCASSGGVIGSALADAGVASEEVDFYAGHQGTWWYRQVTQANAGLHNARFVDSFPTNGSMAACNCPLVLSMGREQGLVGDGDIVVTHAGGNGSTWSALVLRWGRGPG